MEDQKEGRTDEQETRKGGGSKSDGFTHSANEGKQSIATKRKEGKRKGKKRDKSIFKEKKMLTCKLC